MRKQKKRSSLNAQKLFKSKYVLTVGLTIAAILVGLEHLRVLPHTINVNSVIDGIMLVTLGAVIFATLSTELPGDAVLAHEYGKHFFIAIFIDRR